MTYVPGYQHDIFISYAHVDNATHNGVEEGWITTLVSCLNIRIAQLLGRKDIYSLWKDDALSKHVKITPQIMEALHQTAIMIIVLSPGYLASDWCNREKNTFLDLLKESDTRIFLVERDAVDKKEQPSEFDGLIGYRFWLREGERKITRILGNWGQSDDIEYYARVDELAQELVGKLKKLKNEKENNSIVEQDDKSSVFLAQVTDDLEQERNNVKSYLLQAGINVMPNTLYSQEPKVFKESLERDLAKSVLFIQLLSSVAGKKPPDLPQGYVNLQLEVARLEQIPILQWRSPSLDVSKIADEDHKEIVDGETVCAEGIEHFKHAVMESIKEKPVDKSPVDAFVFVDMDTSDRRLAEKICSHLDSNEIGYSLPLEDGDPSDIRKVFEGNLLNCNGIIIIYGSSTAGWVYQQLLSCNKILAQRDKPLQVFAIFEGPPEEKSPLPFKFPKLDVLNFKNGINEDQLESKLEKFMKTIKRGT